MGIGGGTRMEGYEADNCISKSPEEPTEETRFFLVAHDWPFPNLASEVHTFD